MTKTTSRRAILAGGASVAALSVPVIAASTHPDAKLFELDRRLKEAVGCTRALSDVVEDRSKRMKEIWATMPPLPPQPEPPADLADLWRKTPSAALDLLPKDHPFFAWVDATEAERDERSCLYHERRQLVMEQSGLDEAEADLDEAFDKSSEIGNEMCRTRAKTIEGVLIKVNACKLLGSDNDPMEFWYSIKEDIRALAVQS